MRTINDVTAKEFFSNKDGRQGERLLVYSVTGCPPCAALRETIMSLLEADVLNSVTVDWITFPNNDATLRFLESTDVERMPTLFYLRGSEVLGQIDGYLPEIEDAKGRMTRWLERRRLAAA